ncbi:MAG: ATP-binding protein [Candidatus Wolfebacteria bacterium]|nr:ATP-binding protein [Candidatus Wolfebacteria bacterium]
MENIAEKLYRSLSSLSDIQRLIDNGETENQYLECKSPGEPRLDKGLKQQLAEAVSGFANTGGGVIIWGLSTTHHSHSGLDILTQVEEIASIKNFKIQIDLAAASVFEPQIISCQSKLLTKNPSDTKGLIITFIPPTNGDPIRSNIDGKFYIRVRDEFNEMPYETIKRMFAGTSGPDLSALFNNQLVKLRPDGSWDIPIGVGNNSSAAAKDVQVSVTVANKSSCDQISATGFSDESAVNPGVKIFMVDLRGPVFRGKNVIVGNLFVKMKKQKFSKRKLELIIDIFATNMRAKQYIMTVQLAKKAFTVKKTEEKYLY